MRGLVVLVPWWFPSISLDCMFLPGSGGVGLPGILPENPLSLILHPGSSDLFCLVCLLLGAGHPIGAGGCGGCIYRYTLLAFEFWMYAFLHILQIKLSSSDWNLRGRKREPSRTRDLNISFNLHIPLSCQTGTQPAMDCPPHMSATRRAPSSPLPCSISPPHMCPSLASEPWLLLSCPPWTRLSCPQHHCSPQISTRTSSGSRWGPGCGIVYQRQSKVIRTWLDSSSVLTKKMVKYKMPPLT